MKKRDLIHFINEKKFPCLWKLPDDDWICVRSITNKQVFLEGYSVATNVYKCDDGFVGVTGVFGIYNDKNEEEFGIPCTAEEYEAILAAEYVEYVPKN